MKSVAEVLSDQNRALLKIIRETNPDSMAVLAKTSGRQPGNLSRTLKMMSRHGLVDLQRDKTHCIPSAVAEVRVRSPSRVRRYVRTPLHSCRSDAREP